MNNRKNVIRIGGVTAVGQSITFTDNSSMFRSAPAGDVIAIGLMGTPDGFIQSVKAISDGKSSISIGYINAEGSQIGMLCRGRRIKTGNGNFVIDGKILTADDPRILIKVTSNNDSITVEKENEVSVYRGKKFDLTLDGFSIDDIRVQDNDERCISKSSAPQYK